MSRYRRKHAADDVHAVIVIGEDADASLGTVVGTYKAAVSRSMKRSKLWQRGYYDHVIRDDDDLSRVREYIAINPARWAIDPDNPARLPS